MIFFCFQVFLGLVLLLPLVASRPDAQVNQVIDDPEDLLAVESDPGLTSQQHVFVVESPSQQQQQQQLQLRNGAFKTSQSGVNVNNDDDSDAVQNDVDPDLRRIEEAPPGFPGLRLTASGPKKPDSGMQMDVGNPDGSYSFRSVETWIKVDHLANSHLADTTNYQSIVFLGQYLLFMEPTQT